MTPSYRQVTAWHPDALTTLAGALRRVQRGLDNQAPKIGNPVLNLTGGQWTGLSRTAADNRAQSETRWLRNLSDTFGDLATSMEDAVPDIRGAMRALKNAKHSAEDDGYVLRTGDPGYTVDFDASKARDKNAEFDQQAANDWHNRLLTLGQEADRAVTAASKAIAGGLGVIGEMAPASIAQNSSTVDPSKAASDVRAIQDGTATPEQRARFLEASQLTPGQLAALNRGEPIQLPPEQMTYQRQAAGAVDVGNSRVHGIDAFGKFATNDPAVRSALANDLRTISNENVHSAAGNGGYAMLPQSIKDAQNRPDLVSKRGSVVSMNGVKDNQTIGKLLKTGDPQYAAGAGIDKRALEVGRKYTDAQAYYEQELTVGHPATEGGPPLGARALFVDGAIQYDSSSNVVSGTPASAASQIEDILTGSSVDRIAVHDAFTGTNGQDYIHDLMTTRWKDPDVAGSMFATGDHDARVDDPSDPNDRFTSKLTGETMRAVAQYAHTHDGWDALKDIPNTDGKSVGQLNPELLRTLAHSMAPYADDLAGRHDLAMLGFDAEGQLPGHESLINDPGTHNFEGASRLYALFGGDHESANTFYGQAVQDLQSAATHYGHDPNAGNAADDVALVGHLRGLIDEGTAYSSDDSASSALDAAQKAYEMKKSVYETGFKLLNLTPQPGGLQGAALSEFKDDTLKGLIGPAPDPTNFDPNKYNSFVPHGPDVQDFGSIRELMASSIPGDVRSQMDSRFVHDHEGWFDSDGRLRPLQEIAAIPGANGQPRYGDLQMQEGYATIIHQIGDQSGNSDDDKLETARDVVTDQSPELSGRWPKK